jgi:hypothetical protein
MGQTAKNLKPEHCSSGSPPTTGMARFLGWFGAQPIRTTATSENCDQQGVVLNRGRSRVLRFRSVVGSGVIAPRRTNSAHLHRPWRVICATAEAAPPACAASGRILAATPRRFGSQPKISKTTPCKVAGGRRQGRFGPTLDTSGKSTALLDHRTIRQTPVAAFLRGSHGATVASLADPQNGRSPRHITLPSSVLALPLLRERNRSQQAMISMRLPERATAKKYLTSSHSMVLQIWRIDRQ